MCKTRRMGHLTGVTTTHDSNLQECEARGSLVRDGPLNTRGDMPVFPPKCTEAQLEDEQNAFSNEASYFMLWESGESYITEDHDEEVGEYFHLLDTGIHTRVREGSSARVAEEQDDTLDLAFPLFSCRKGMGLSHDDYNRILHVVTHPLFKPWNVKVKTAEQLEKYMTNFIEKVFGKEEGFPNIHTIFNKFNGYIIFCVSLLQI